MADLTIASVTRVRPLLPSMVVRGEAGESLSLGDIVHRNSSGKFVKANASSSANANGQLGMVVGSGEVKQDGSVASGATVDVLVKGRVAAYESQTPATLLYLSDTAGKLADAAGTTSRKVGTVETADVVWIDPELL